MIETFNQHPQHERLLIGNKGTIVSTANWIQLKTCLSNKGYEELVYRLGSRTDGSRRTLNLKVHRLVGELYVPNKENKPTINHLDGNKLNQDYRNLSWATCGENNLHALRTGLRVNKAPSKEHRKKINEGIRKRWKNATR